MDALTTCNSCDAAPMVEGDPRGYCAACGLESAQSTMESAKRHRDAVASKLTEAWDRDEPEAALEVLRKRVAGANDILDRARDGVRAASRSAWRVCRSCSVEKVVTVSFVGASTLCNDCKRANRAARKGLSS